MIPPNISMKEGLVLEVHGYIPYWREKGQTGKRPVCAMPKAKQDKRAADANKTTTLPVHPVMRDGPSRRQAAKINRESQAGPVLSSHRYCPDLDTEDTKVWERKDYGVKHFQPTRSSGPPWAYCVSRSTYDIETKELIQELNLEGVEPHMLTAPIPGGRARNIQSRFYYRPPPEGIPVVSEEDNRLMKEAKTLRHLLTHLPKTNYAHFV